MSTTPHHHDPVVTTSDTSVRDAALERVRRTLPDARRQAVLDARDAGLSVADIAAACGVQRSTVHRWIGGRA